MADDFLSKLRLKDSKESTSFKPFKVSSSMNALLKPIVDAFENSDKVTIGYSTLEKNKGLTKPTLKRKTIYLTGGALRDHLKGKTFRNYDLVTDATPDEIIMILKNAETNFIFLSEPEQTNKTDIIFYPSRYDDENNMMELTVERNGQKAYISTMNSNTKDRSKNVRKAKFCTSIDLDSKTRDITINSLYLKLKNSDGENAELLDPVGGVHDLKSGQIVTISGVEDTLNRYPYLGFRLASLATRFSEDKRIPEKIINVMNDEDIDMDLNPHVLKDMFVKTIEDSTTYLEDYLKNLVDSNMIHKLFPDCTINEIKPDLPNNKITLISYLLCKNSPDKIQSVLSKCGFLSTDIDEILIFVKMANESLRGSVDSANVESYFKKPSRLPKSRIQEFIHLFKKGPENRKIENDDNEIEDDFSDENVERYIKRIE